MTSALDWLEPHTVPLEHPAPATSGERVVALLRPGSPAPPGDGPLAAAMRARGYADDLPSGAVLCRSTALWVHTGRFGPGRLEAAHPAGRRLPGGVRRCCSAHLDGDDVMVVGDVPVTSLGRTAADAARFWPLGRAADAVLALRDAGLDLRDLDDRLMGYGRRPYVRRARDLVAALAQSGRPGPQPSAGAPSGALREPVIR